MEVTYKSHGSHMEIKWKSNESHMKVTWKSHGSHMEVIRLPMGKEKFDTLNFSSSRSTPVLSYQLHLNIEARSGIPFLCI